MCSITTNKNVDDILEGENDQQRTKIEKRLFQFAEDSTVEKSGILDDKAPLTRYSGDLKLTRKIDVGRHRAYYTGFHTHCTYKLFHIKINKKEGVDDDDDPRFKRFLLKVMKEPQQREISPPAIE